MMLSFAEYEYILRRDLMSFIERSFYELNPQTRLLLAPHIELIAAKLEACRRGEINRLIINLPPLMWSPLQYPLSNVLIVCNHQRRRKPFT